MSGGGRAAVVVHAAADTRGAEVVAYSLRPQQVDLIDVENASATDFEQSVPYIGIWSAASSSSPVFRAVVEAAHDRHSLVSITLGQLVAVPVRFRMSLALNADQLRAGRSPASSMLRRQLNRVRQQMLPAQTDRLGLDEIRAVVVSGVDRRGLDLANRDLGGLDLRNGLLNGANLLCANLSGCQLDNARLVGANLERCALAGTQMCDADLRLANLWHADMTGAKGVDTGIFIHTNMFGVTGVDGHSFPRSFSKGSYAAYIQYFTVNLGFTMRDVYESFPWLSHKYFDHLLS